MTPKEKVPKIREFQELLETFEKIPKAKQNKTLMQVAGYAHYENVASNILAFFFDPNEEHELGDTLLRDFLNTLGISTKLDLSYADVQREVSTENGKRIDIIITGEDFAICIENKIFHWLANDLQEYSSTMEKIGYSKKHIIKAVLAPNPTPKDQLTSGFKSISYPQLWDQARPSIEEKTTESNTRWITFLNDFMDTTENFASQHTTQLSCDHFFSKNHDEIESMLQYREDFYNRLRQKNSGLLALLSERGVATTHCKLWQAYKRTCLVLDFIHPQDHQISFDLFISPEGWKLLLFGRKRHSKLFLEQLLQKHSEDFSKHFAMPMASEWSKHVAKTWNLETSTDEIAYELEQIIPIISSMLKVNV